MTEDVGAKIGSRRHAGWQQRALAALLAAPSIWLALLFWRTPVDDPLTVTALLLDRTLQACTAVMPLAVVVTLFAPWPFARFAVVTNGVVSVLLGGSAALAALRPPVDPWPTALAIVSLLCGVVLICWVLQRKLLSMRWKLSLLAPLALLPAIQFWHATSFVPTRLSTSMTVTARTTVQQAVGGDLRGVVEIDLRNNGGVGALLLASEVTRCFRKTPVDRNYNLDNRYADPACSTGGILDTLSVVDAHSTSIYHLAFTTPASKPLVQLVAQLWYARTDRLRIDTTSKRMTTSGEGCHGRVVIYRVQDEARFRGVVQRDRLLVYDEDQSEGGRLSWYLTTTNEPPCQGSRYRIGDYVGTANIRLNQEDWLQAPE